MKIAQVCPNTIDHIQQLQNCMSMMHGGRGEDEGARGEDKYKLCKTIHTR